MATQSIVKIQQTETEVAILQVQVKNIEDKVSELKVDIKDVRESIERHSDNQEKILKDMKETSANAHKAMSQKIAALEKWRWMMMGAGIVIGSLGFDSLAKLFH